MKTQAAAALLSCGLLLAGCSTTTPSTSQTPVRIQVDAQPTTAVTVEGEPAQVTVDARDGQDSANVKVGAEGVTVDTKGGQDSASVKVGAGGVSVDVPGKAQVKVGAQGINVAGGAGSVKVGADGVQVQGGAVEAAGDEVLIQGAGMTKTVEMDGKDLVVQGSNHNITVTGTVGQLQVQGTDNVVTVESVEQIVVNGVGNKVKWAGEEPAVSLNGMNNEVSGQ